MMSVTEIEGEVEMMSVTEIEGEVEMMSVTEIEGGGRGICGRDWGRRERGTGFSRLKDKGCYPRSSGVPLMLRFLTPDL